jgi:hypothetical protein
MRSWRKAFGYHNANDEFALCGFFNLPQSSADFSRAFFAGFERANGNRYRGDPLKGIN